MPDFEAEQQTDSLEGIVPSIDVIPKEQIIGEGNAAPDFKQLHQVIELTVHIPTDKNGCPDINHI
jgi:hypothetical protein